MTSEPRIRDFNASLLARFLRKLVNSRIWRVVRWPLEWALGGLVRLRGLELKGSLAPPRGFRFDLHLWAVRDDWRHGSNPLELEKQLWAGYQDDSLRLLRGILSDRESSPLARARAAWVLARWNSAVGDCEKALDHVVMSRIADPSWCWELRVVLLEVDCLVRLGRGEEAEQLVRAAAEFSGWQPELHLAMANVMGAQAGDAAASLGHLNDALADAGVAPLSLEAEDEPLAIGNLCAREAGAGTANGPTVSVLVPVYNAADMVSVALKSLLAQTWRDLDIVVIDDCSSDDTVAVVESFAELDGRVRLIRQSENGGAYKARLAGLAVARGELITVHDGDDWSHPQKVELQARALIGNKSMAANMTSWSRVTDEMYVKIIGAIPSGRLLRQNESSLMFRRELVDEIGTWDDARAGSDTEYIWRIQARFGSRSIGRIHPGVPLSFSLHRDTSLTRTGPTHVRTIFHGSRRVYREAQKWWHRTCHSADLNYAPSRDQRPFYCPPNLLERRPAARHYDVVLIGDFGRDTTLCELLEQWTTAAVEGSAKVAIFHWHHFDRPAMRPVLDVYQALAAAGRLDILAVEDNLSADVAVVLDAESARFRLQGFPKWQFSDIGLVCGHPDQEDVPNLVWPDPVVMHDHVSAVTGRAPRWVPFSAASRRAMLHDQRYVEVIDTSALDDGLESVTAELAPHGAMEKLV